MDKKYSVLMSVYYKEKPEYLKLSIESMLNQTLKPDEIVIVKDGKLTKELEDVIQYYSSVYPNIFTIISLKNNVGLGLALNEGLKKCRNELVARMDTDDVSLKERCELQVSEFIKNKNLCIVGSMIDEFYDDPTKPISSRVVPTKHEDILKFSKRRNPFNHPTVMYKKSEVLKCGGYKDIKRNQDYDLFVRMLHNGCLSMNINKSLVLFRANKENLKRRKSWVKCKSNIVMAYSFWRNNFSSFLDFLIVAVAQIVVFISPIWLFNYLSKLFLRKKYVSKGE